MRAEDPPTILLVEDDPVLRTFLADNLTADGFELILADCLRDGLRELEYRRPDLAIVHVGLPDGVGARPDRARAGSGRRRRRGWIRPCRWSCSRGTTELDRMRGFERGADDFVIKPSASMSAPPEARLAVGSPSGFAARSWR